MNTYRHKTNYGALLFWLLPFSYCLYYAPYGINETDGGFLTGLAWQLLSGKTLYADVLYVRPPLPVWLRSLELIVLPEHWAILGERWIFYWKVALYAYLAAMVLQKSPRHWILACFGFVLSAHCYPASAWHTVDGILFGVLSIWCWTRLTGQWSALFSGLCLVAMLLCKQSFYPMSLVWAVLVFFARPAHQLRIVWALAGVLLPVVCFIGYLWHNGLLANYLELTMGASSAKQAVEHGLLDYFRIQPILLVFSAALLLPAAWWAHRKQYPKRVLLLWTVFLLALAGSYTWTIGQRQAFTLPFAQTRLLFLGSVFYSGWMHWTKQWSVRQALPFWALLALSWSAAVSWGYNLPILFALPWVFVVLEISQKTYTAAMAKPRPMYLPAIILVLLLAIFRWSYEFVYRDGSRSAMTVALGGIFPKLSGIYSNPATAALYRDLDHLTHKYGPTIKTLPAFPQANYLTGTRPPLPIDWVVKREIGLDTLLVFKTAQRFQPYYLVEKSYLKQIQSDPELDLVKKILASKTVVEESPFFLVLQK